MSLLHLEAHGNVLEAVLERMGRQQVCPTTRLMRDALTPIEQTLGKRISGKKTPGVHKHKQYGLQDAEKLHHMLKYLMRLCRRSRSARSVRSQPTQDAMNPYSRRRPALDVGRRACDGPDVAACSNADPLPEPEACEKEPTQLSPSMTCSFLPEFPASQAASGTEDRSDVDTELTATDHEPKGWQSGPLHIGWRCHCMTIPWRGHGCNCMAMVLHMLWMSPSRP